MDPVLEPKLVNRLTDLLTILSKKDALTIFLLAKDGLKAEADTPDKIGLTRKQYYTRLKQLVDTCLIDKYDDAYVHTTLGTFVHQKHLLELIEQMKNTEQMKMVDTLKRTRQFSEDAITGFVGKITGVGIASTAVPIVRAMLTYEDMVSVIVERIQFAKKEILLATRYLNDLIVNNILMKAKTGLDVRVLADSKLVKKYTESSERLQMVDKNILERMNVATNPYYPASKINRKLTDVPFSVIIFDRKEVAVELINSYNAEQFNSALLIRDETIATEFVKYFEVLWERSNDSISDVVKDGIASESKLSSP